MAFRQPTYHAPQRIYTAPAEHQTATRPSSHIADSQEWILFSPSAASTTDRGYTASTVRTRTQTQTQTQTAGRSRISDFGSLDTAARSYDYDEASQEEEAMEEEEEDGELDSLDSHLHEFRAEPSVYNQGDREEQTVLPTHDGLGSFRLDQTMMGEEVQEHLYAFERFNPRRVKRRRESLELGMLELENERAAEAERTKRIEKWRMEQSRLLVDEIQKETRRRKQSMSTDRSAFVDREQEDVATMSNVDSENTVEEHVADEENESFWNRITRRVIRDLIGIDDDLLEIIFGESLPEDDDLSTTPPATSSLDTIRGVVPANQFKEDCWEHRFLERIARELGILVNQISDHPGAFSTYLQSTTQPLPYAGLPVIPETARPQPQPEPPSSILTSPADLEFQPTIQPSSIPIITTSLTPSPFEDVDSTPRPSNHLSQPLTREEWERDLDIKMVFRYLRSRFTAKFSAPQPASQFDFQTTVASHLATASIADNAARAARVRQHHPLVTRQTTTRERRRSIEKRTWKPTIPGGGPSSPGAILQRRGSSSCASVERPGLGARRSSRTVSGSSKHYWDFGPGGSQSVESGSLIASTGGMGSWGEV